MKTKEIKQIRECLEAHYQKQGYVDKELERAEKTLKEGKEYYFQKGLFGTKYDNREARIFKRDGVYGLYHGWGKSSDKAFTDKMW